MMSYETDDERPLNPKFNEEELTPERIKLLFSFYKCPKGHIMRKLALLGTEFISSDFQSVEIGYMCPICYIIDTDQDMVS